MYKFQPYGNDLVTNPNEFPETDSRGLYIVYDLVGEEI